jgi:hypothetical protein
MVDYHIIVEDVLKADVNARIGQIIEIVRHTANTWQQKRKAEEKMQDAVLGKAAETGFEQYCRKEGLSLRTWDELRDDGFLYHSSVDGFLAKVESAQRLNSEQFLLAARQAKPEDQAYFNSNFLRRCENEPRIYGYEVKSTRIASRHMVDGELAYNTILNDDFMVYPRVRRVPKGQFTNQLKAQLMRPEELEAIKVKTPHLLIRAYMQEENDRYKVHLVRWITREDFFNKAMVKRMSRPGKSDEALYYAVQLSEGHPLFELGNNI